VKSSLRKTLGTLGKLLTGVIKGGLRRESLGKLIAVQRISSKLRKLYENYPKNPQPPQWYIKDKRQKQKTAK
jgi:hypothetical protein